MLRPTGIQSNESSQSISSSVAATHHTHLPHQVIAEDFSRLRLQFQEKGSWFLLHNNASAPSAMTALRLLTTCNVIHLTLSQLCFIYSLRKKTNLKG